MFTCVFRRPVASTVLLLKPFRVMGTIPVDRRAEVKIPIQQLNQLQLSGRNGVGECIVGVSGNIGLCTLLGLTPNSTDKPNKRPKDRSLRSHCKAFSLNAAWIASVLLNNLVWLISQQFKPFKFTAVQAAIVHTDIGNSLFNHWVLTEGVTLLHPLM